jgi:hypothetical protein
MIKFAILASLFSATSILLAPAYACCLKHIPGYDEDTFGRRLAFVDDPQAESELQAVPLEKCGPFDYLWFLHVNGHMMFVGFPLAEARGCPVIAFHDHIGATPGKVHQKEMIMVTDMDEIEEAMVEERLLDIGTFQLSEVVKAFQDASTGEDDEYDALNNNCAGLLVSMASSLGIKADSHSISHITKQLTATVSRSNWFDLIQESTSVDALFNDSAIQDKEVIERVVEYHLAELM